jgi:hypothetical protein
MSYLYKKQKIMSRDELKEEISKVLETVPDEILEDVLDYLKLLISNPKEKLAMTTRLRQIINEDEELLQKLAK